MNTNGTKKLAVLIILIGALSGFAFSRSSAPISTDAEREITKRLDDWATARVKGDISFLEGFYAKELVLTGTNGSLIPRDTDIASFAKREIKPESIQNDDLKITVYCNDVAVASGRETVKGTYKGNYDAASIRFLAVFVHRDGRWQLVSAQGTRIVSK